MQVQFCSFRYNNHEYELKFKSIHDEKYKFCSSTNKNNHGNDNSTYTVLHAMSVNVQKKQSKFAGKILEIHQFKVKGHSVP